MNDRLTMWIWNEWYFPTPETSSIVLYRDIKSINLSYWWNDFFFVREIFLNWLFNSFINSLTRVLQSEELVFFFCEALEKYINKWKCCRIVISEVKFTVRRIQIFFFRSLKPLATTNWNWIFFTNRKSRLFATRSVEKIPQLRTLYHKSNRSP